MIFVDTSVWIEALREEPGPTARRLSALLDSAQVGLAAPVRLELLSGAPRASLTRLRRVLSALPLYYPTRDTWSLVERWVETAVAKGQRFGLGDLLIGAIAAERGGEVWSLDADFARMARLKFLRCHVPR